MYNYTTLHKKKKIINCPDYADNYREKKKKKRKVSCNNQSLL